ncbi:MAG: FtsH protease activity modulator HflK [Verrucomicrobiota bacterium]|jgi:membrane protease subunit HflK|nr:FtsH protease activity modulator HflK [Verrucomicrobiota bacterium]
MSQQIEINIPDLLRKGFVLWILVGLLVVVGFITSMYTVQAESEGVVLRFGKYHKTVDPGLRFKLPFGIDNVYVLPVRRQLKQEYGYGTAGGSNDSQFAESRTRSREKSMVTGDLNAAEVEWVVQYRINNARNYLFKVLDPEGTLRYLSESVMRTVIGDRTVDEVITIGRQEIEEEARDRLDDAVKKFQLGIAIDQIQLQNVNPPPPVQASFNEVNQAQQERERMINEANGEYNQEVPRSRGVADQKIQAAQGYALKRVNEALGDVARFNAMFGEYKKAPEVTKTRLYWESMKEMVPKMGKKIILDEDASQILPLLQLNQDGNGGNR